jgi:hypothetical protein
LTHLIKVHPPSSETTAAATTTAATAKSTTAAAAKSTTATAALGHQRGCSQSQRDHTAGQDQCLLQYVHNFHWFKVLFDSTALLSGHRIRNASHVGNYCAKRVKGRFTSKRPSFLLNASP